MQKRPTNQTKPTNEAPASMTNIRAHQAAYQRKAVARGSKVGLVEPP